MKKEVKLVKKIEHLLKQLNCRKYLHYFGPKKYQLKHHLFALIMVEAFQLSLRRVEKLLEMFGIKVPTYSALCKRRKKIPSWIWDKLVLLTSGLQHDTVAIDATGFSKTNPSFHYIKRIDSKNPVKGFARLCALYDVKKHKIIIINVRIKPAHETKDARILLNGYCKMQCLLGDKAFDAEWIHQYCYERNVQTVIPKKKNIHRGIFRKKQMKKFSEKLYHLRSNIESGFSAIKRKYGSSVSGKKVSSVKAELYCKAIAHNLELFN